MRISDWSSDVCSSDLKQGTNSIAFDRHRVGIGRFDREVGHLVDVRVVHSVMRQCHRNAETDRQRMKIVRKAVQSHRTADRKSVVSGKSVSVRVDLGGRSIIKKKKST